MPEDKKKFHLRNRSGDSIGLLYDFEYIIMGAYFVIKQTNNILISNRTKQ